MSTVDDALKTQLHNIEEKYGKTIDEWITLIKESGKVKHTEIVAMLKEQYGMTHGSAHRVSLKARETDAESIIKTASENNIDPILAMYEAKKANLKPIHDKIMSIIDSFGDDIELAPKKGYVSIRRKKQFAMIQPSTATRVDVCLILKDTPITERLEAAKSFNALFTHRVRLSNLDEVDEQLGNWIRQAYEQA